MSKQREKPIPYTLGERCRGTNVTGPAGRSDPFHSPAASPRLGRTPDTVPAKENRYLHEGGRRAAVAVTTDKPETAVVPAGPYACDSAKAILRKQLWPDCPLCERLEAKVAEAGRAVRIQMVALCADYPSMYANEISAWEQSVAPLVATLKGARKLRDAHQKKAGHQP